MTVLQARIRLVGTIRQQADGRWVAEVTDLRGVVGSGATPDEAREAATELARRVIADRLDVDVPEPIRFASWKES
jgi:predicted RNase H-like HicB family nuclease